MKRRGESSSSASGCSKTNLPPLVSLSKGEPLEEAKAKLTAAKEKFGKEIRVFETAPSSSLQNAESNTDKFLKTRKNREPEKAARRSRITKAVIRVRFPDNTTLEATFHPSETLQSLVDLLMKVVARPELSFQIYTTPPKKLIKDMTQDFYSAGFAPGAIIYFSYDIPKGDDTADVKSGPFLHEEIMSLKGLELVKELAEPVQTAPEAIQQASLKGEEKKKPPVVQEKKPAKKNLVYLPKGEHLGESSSSSSNSSKTNLSPLVFLPTGIPLEAPWTILNHLPAPPGEDRMVRREKIFLFQGYPRVKPKVLHVFSDGSYSLETTVPPSASDVLELIGHSKGLVCFRNPNLRQICIWDLEDQTVREMIDDVNEEGEASYGFGHKTGGLYMMVRLGRPHYSITNQDFTWYCDTILEGGRWRRFEVTATYHFEQGRPATYVSQNHRMYWKAAMEDGVYIITFDLETEQLGGLVAPLEPNRDMVLGHGFNGQLAAAIYVPPTGSAGTKRRLSFLHIWVLLKELEWYRWHKLVTLPSSVYTSADEVFIPLVFYYGKEDGAINLLFHLNMMEVLRIIPAVHKHQDHGVPLNHGFTRVDIPSAIPSGMQMELGSWRRFQATPLGNLLHRSKKHNGHKSEEDKNNRGKRIIRLCCEDDDIG